MSNFEITNRNRVRRVPDRGAYDKTTLYEIIDEALICHVGFVQDDQPFIIPTLVARRNDEILLHGATTSRLIRHISEGHNICISVSHVDGLVLARSVFHHSVNYRSAVIFGHGSQIDNDEEKMAALEAFTEKLLPGRWTDARLPNPKEMKATAVVSILIDTASSKIRTGPPGDDEEDLVLPVWAGVLPVKQIFGSLEPDKHLRADIEIPEYLTRFTEDY